MSKHLAYLEIEEVALVGVIHHSPDSVMCLYVVDHELEDDFQIGMEVLGALVVFLPLGVGGEEGEEEEEDYSLHGIYMISSMNSKE